MTQYDAVHHRHPQAGPLANRLGGKKRIEDTRKNGGIHAGPIVADGHAKRLLPLLQARFTGNAGKLGTDGHLPQSNFNQTITTTHRLHCIGRNVDQYLFDLAFIGQHARRVRRALN